MANRSKDRDYLRVVNNDTPPAAPAIVQAAPEPTARSISEPPADYDKAHREVWAEVLLQARGRLQSSDRWNLEVLVRAIVLHTKASAKVAEFGSVIKSPSGYPIQSPYVSDMNKQAEKIRKMSSELGLTTAARERGSKGKSPQGSRKRGPFSDIRTLADD